MTADYLLRDLAGNGEEASHSLQPTAKKEILWPAWGMTAFGAVSLFVLRILASVNRTYISPSFTESQDGTERLYDPGGYTDFWWYIEQRDLGWLFGIAICALTAGICLLLWRWLRSRKKEKV